MRVIDAAAGHLAARLASYDAQRSQDLATCAELRALRAQINPHFLFNALGMLAQLSQHEPLVERAILNLSRVFRHALDSTRQDTVRLAARG
jgi:LytS/YehU family sensor histidine kinase